MGLGALAVLGAGCGAGSDQGGEGVAEAAPAIAIAHRGASAYAPEHTMAAYELALEMGADFIEPDLQVTRDGVLVALHDLTLERTTDVGEVFPDRFREEEVRGARVRRWYVSDFTLEEIQTLDAGSWFSEEFVGERVPTFADVIYLARGRAGLIPETKEPEVYSDLGFSMERLVLADLASFGLDRKDADLSTPVVVQSFSEASLMILRHEVGSDLPSVFLISGPDAPQWLTPEGLTRVAGFATGIGPTKRLLLDNPGAVELAHAAGLTVIPWTFSAEDSGSFDAVGLEMAHFIFELGVDGLFTNNPDLFPRTPPGAGS
jgi:glycerophosphoryl diester phosphodiesterase